MPLMAAETLPLATAHAHNDYHHDQPLIDALAQGFCSVEADVFLVDGQLLVGHDRSELRSERTLERLYLAPLRTRADQQGGRIYRNGPPLTLLIDFKSAAEPTYAALEKLLQDYKPLLVRLVDGQRHDGAVQIVISGNRPTNMVAQQYQDGNALVAIDGRLTDLDTDGSRPWLPLISDRWTAHFRWNGEGTIPDDELEKLQTLVHRAHEQNRRLRLWATADRPEMWETLHSVGVDLINTDDLAGLAKFLRNLQSTTPQD